MPRVFMDHRSPLAKRLREGYDALAARFDLTDGTVRRVAVMTATAWIDYQTLVAEAAALANKPRAKDKVMGLSRLRRRQAKAAGQYLAGLKALEALAVRNGHGQDLASQLARLHREGSSG